MEYTKAPWKALDNNCVVSGNGFDMSVIVCCGNTDEAKANAHLIAAAPDTTKALRDLISFLIHNGFITGNNQVTLDLVGIINKGTKALAKAEMK